jgi:hypothetical protein
MHINITQNVPVMEMYCAFPFEACFISEEYKPAKEGIFITLFWEPLSDFLEWIKLKLA